MSKKTSRILSKFKWNVEYTDYELIFTMDSSLRTQFQLSLRASDRDSAIYSVGFESLIAASNEFTALVNAAKAAN